LRTCVLPSFANLRSSFVCELAFFLRGCARPRLTSFLPSRDSRLRLVTFPERSYKEFRNCVDVALGFELNDGWTRRVARTGEFVSPQTQFVVTIEVGVVGASPQCPIWPSKSAGKTVGRRALCRDLVVCGRDMHRDEFAWEASGEVAVHE
jgi:hypothetical protein